MSRREARDVFGLSFLDMISCGLGGVIVLMLIFASMSGQGGDAPRAVGAGKGMEATRPSATFFVLQIDVTAAEGTPAPTFDLLLPTGAREGLKVRRPVVTAGDGLTARFVVVAETTDLPAGAQELAFTLMPAGSGAYEVRARLLSDVSRQTSILDRSGATSIAVADFPKLPKLLVAGG